MTDSDKRRRQERLALLGLAADRREPAGACPDDQTFAELLEAGPESAERQRFLLHLSACESCFRKWLAVSEELEPATAEKTGAASRFGRRRTLAAVGSACALAMGVMLYLAIDYRPLVKDEGAGSGLATIEAPAPGERKRATEPAVDQALSEPRAVSPAVQGSAFEPSAEKLGNMAQPLPARPTVEADKQVRPEAGSSALMRKAAPARPAAGQFQQVDDTGRQAEQALAESESAAVQQRDAAAPETAGFAEDRDALGSYIDLLEDLCDAGEGATAAESLDQYAVKGRELLESGAVAGSEKRRFVEDIVELMEKAAPFADNDVAPFCKRVRELIREQSAGAGKTSSGMERK